MLISHFDGFLFFFFSKYLLVVCSGTVSFRTLTVISGDSFASYASTVTLNQGRIPVYGCVCRRDDLFMATSGYSPFDFFSQIMNGYS